MTFFQINSRVNNGRYKVLLYICSNVMKNGYLHSEVIFKLIDTCRQLSVKIAAFFIYFSFGSS